MDLTIPSSSQLYLADLAQTQARLQKAQLQVSSGHRLQQVSDDPSAVKAIYEDQSQIAATQQTQTNLAGATTELNTADGSLQSAVSLLQQAVSLAAQGASSTATADSRATLAIQVSAIQQELVGLSQTAVNGRYIFSGDQDSQPPYQLDQTQPNGVQQLVSAPSTRVIEDINGTPIAVSRTAQEIFDATDASGNATSGNVFAAIQSLLTGLTGNDTGAIAQSIDSLKSAGSWLNDQLAFYGTAENRIADASSMAQKFLTQEQGSLSNVQDADLSQAALQLTQAETAQQATLSVEAKVQQTPNLFSYLA